MGASPAWPRGTDQSRDQVLLFLRVLKNIRIIAAQSNPCKHWCYIHITSWSVLNPIILLFLPSCNIDLIFFWAERANHVRFGPLAYVAFNKIRNLSQAMWLQREQAHQKSHYTLLSQHCHHHRKGDCKFVRYTVHGKASINAKLEGRYHNPAVWRENEQEMVERGSNFIIWLSLMETLLLVIFKHF